MSVYVQKLYIHVSVRLDAINYRLLIYVKLKLVNNLEFFTHACMHLILKRKNHRNDDEKMYIKLPKLCVMSDGLQRVGPNHDNLLTLLFLGSCNRDGTE